MHRISGRILLIAAAFALFLVPIAAIAAGGFDDVGDGNVFKADIEWLADAGVTKGCNPPANTKFCPESNVTREQMAAFMHRLAVNKVVDAGTVQGMTAAQLKGAKGDTGPTGPTGPPGADGALPAGVAQAVDGALVELSEIPKTILSVDIATPAAGYVLVQASFEARIFHTYTYTDACYYDVSAIDATMPTDLEQRIQVDNLLGTGEFRFMSAASRVYPVTGAGTHTFYFVGRESNGTCTAEGVVLTASYFPVAYGDI